MRRAARLAFWGSAGALVYAQAGYPLLLAGLARARRGRRPPAGDEARPDAEPTISLIIAAHREAGVIADKVANALALDWPRERLEVIVACDGSPDDTPARARAAGADRVLDLPWGGKVRAQDAARRERPRQPARLLGRQRAVGARRAARARRPLRRPGGRLRLRPGRVRLRGREQPGGALLALRDGGPRARVRLASVTAGNGAIYAVRAEAYVRVDPVMGHDLTLPFTLVKRGWRAVYEPGARASEKMVPTIEGEFARKRRMMSHMWVIVLRGGLLSPRGYPPLYALMIASHRVLRYVGPFLHVVALAASLVLALSRDGRRARRAGGPGRAGRRRVAGGRVRSRPLLVARYYVLTTASIAAGLVDHLRHGTAAGWTPPEGTR